MGYRPSRTIPLMLAMIALLLISACTTSPTPTATAVSVLTSPTAASTTATQQPAASATAAQPATTPTTASTGSATATGTSGTPTAGTQATPQVTATQPAATATAAQPASTPSGTATGQASEVSAVPGVNPYIAGQVPATAPQPPVRYTIDVSLDPKNNMLHGNARIRFTNTSKTTWNEVFFRTYPNAFSDQALAQKAFFGQMQETYPNGFDPAWMKIMTNTQSFTLQPDSYGAQTSLRYQPPQPIASGASAEVTIPFDAKIPQAQHRFCVWNDIYALGQWYPMLAVYDEGKGWFKDPYYANGDPFYDYISLFDVRITVPADFQVASTGIETEATPSADGQTKTHRMVSGLVREFAFATSARYKVSETKAGDVTVRSFAPAEAGNANATAAQYAADAINYYSRTYGQYPYKVMNIAATAFPGGMEFPNVVFIGTALYPRPGTLEFVIAHEVGHQWFYGMIGNNEVQAPFLDEGITEFSTYAYAYDKYGGPEQAMAKLGRGFRLPAPNPSQEAGLMRRSVTSFNSFQDYNTVIYDYSAEMLLRFRDAIGTDRFNKIMQAFFQQYKYKNATVDDFLNVVRETGGQDAYDWLKPYS